ncbi:MAG: lytic transglycosylase domain-containing protein [Pyrinomonadaceae bacterium]|nr:lytic transglycosylase domain-containing protein [Pyrinomonadaceae bacterium]
MNAGEGVALKNSYKKSYKPILMMGSSTSMKKFTTGDQQIDSYIVGASRKYRIDPLLIYAQMHQESAFKKRARSHKGASGLMQLMPATARRFGVTKIYDPEQNIYAGVRYMRWLLNKFNGNVVLALAGYNAGEGAVMKYGNNVPPYRETREYVRRITGRYNQISNPSYRSAAVKVDRKQAAKITKAKAKPLTVLELDVVTVKLPNGRMRLVSN